MVTAGLAPALRRRLRGVSLAAITHGQDVVLPVAPYQRWLRRVFRSLDVVLPVSRATGRACADRGAPPDRIVVQPNGIHTDRFVSTPSSWLAERTGAPDAAFHLLSVGRQVKRKGTAWFIEHVLPLLPTSVHYSIVGAGPEDEKIRATAERCGLSNRVHPLGRVSEEELPIALSNADLFVMPNVPVPGDMEGFGVVMLEAGLCGLPTIAAELEGVADVITNGENGHLVPPLSPERFAEQIAAYVSDRAALASLSERASRFTVDNFAWPSVADQLVQTLERAVYRGNERDSPAT